MKNSLEITNLTKGTLPRVPFALLHKKILGEKYELSISFVGNVQMKKLSVEYKGDTTHMNVLSFPLTKETGEIVLNLSAIKKEAPKFDQTYAAHLNFLVIHGMLHLAGFVHGSRMESEEKRLMKTLGF